jgi:hypothetical protein
MIADRQNRANRNRLNNCLERLLNTIINDELAAACAVGSYTLITLYGARCPNNSKYAQNFVVGVEESSWYVLLLWSRI